MRVGAAWVDACIHNVSARGLLVASDEAPRAGSYVEIRRGRNVIIGRAVWKKDRFFGVRTQDPIDLPALQREPRQGMEGPDGAVERRTEARFKQDAVTARALERSLAMSRAVQFGLVAFAAAAASAVIATAAYRSLAAPIDRIQRALSGDF